MTEEEIKQNIGKILEEYPKKCTNSESIFNWKNERQTINELTEERNIAQTIIGCLACDLAHGTFHKEEITWMVEQYMKEYCPNFDYKNTTFERIIK